MTLVVSQIPTEILTAIFEAGHDFDPYLHLSVAHVSRKWRQVSLGSPRLWTQIIYNSTQPIDILSTHLSHSSPHLIDLDIGLMDNHLKKSASVPQIFDYIKPHAHRWRSLTIYSCSLPQSRDAIDQLRHMQVPHLEHVDISLHVRLALYASEPLYSLASPFIFAGGAPLLSRVRLLGIAVSQHSQIIFMPPLSNVTSFHLCTPIGSYAMAEFLQMLSAAPALTNLVIERALLWLGGSIPQVVMPSLRSLVVREATLVTSHLIESISAPILEHITLVEFGIVPLTVFNYMQQLHAGKFPSLKILCLLFPELPVDAIVSLLRSRTDADAQLLRLVLPAKMLRSGQEGGRINDLRELVKVEEFDEATQPPDTLIPGFNYSRFFEQRTRSRSFLGL